MTDRAIERFATPSELHHAAAGSIVRFLDDAIRVRGLATICLSGGSTPKAVYELLAAEHRLSLDWTKVHFFWGDERCGPPDHPESNFRMTNEVLLQRISIADENIHRIEAERPPKEAADRCEAELKMFFGLQGNRMPRFDITLLGLGEDGHTASLFPGTTILNESNRLIAEVFVEKLKAYRISMTYPVFNNSRVILFLVSGSGKAKILHEVLEGEPGRYPAQQIQPADGILYWLVDQPAALHLSSL